MLLLCCQVALNSDMCVRVRVCAWMCVFHLAFAQAELSPGLQALPRGRKSSWANDVTSSAITALDRKQRKKTVPGTDWGFRVVRSVWQSEKHSDKDTRKEWTPARPLERQTSRLWLTDRLWAEDGEAVTAPHQANWLTETGSVVPTPWGRSEELTAIPVSELRSGLAQRGIRDGV